MNVKFCSGCSVPLKVTMKACPLLTINSLLENLLVWWSLAFSFRCQLVLGCVAAMKKWEVQENLRVHPRRRSTDTLSRIACCFLQVTSTHVRFPPKIEIIYLWAFFERERDSTLHRLLEIICINKYRRSNISGTKEKSERHLRGENPERTEYLWVTWIKNLAELREFFQGVIHSKTWRYTNRSTALLPLGKK